MWQLMRYAEAPEAPKPTAGMPAREPAPAPALVEATVEKVASPPGA
jgi:hypothetical protein